MPVEIRKDSVGLMELPRYQSCEPHSTACLLRKDLCDVRGIEVARFVRLLKSSTELVSFTVPRYKAEYFHDDLYPPTRKIWEASMSVDDYINKKDNLQGTLDLQPEGLQKMSEADSGAQKIPRYNSKAELRRVMMEKGESTSDFLGNVMEKVKIKENDPILHEEKEGISESEWDD
ncbi:Coronin-7 [Thelohanellus kitauei]|uniref:Coronin-7 n=1 Tax=Thelohanellus kitauei TaxID=669202 RepID=A0A0C2M4X7_THEKT|nr:Coronin-7 [Thelohanellus kitauei]